MMPQSSVLPNEWDSGSHRYCRSSVAQHAELGLRHALPAPAAVQQLDALGPAGGAGGVDQRGQVVRADAGDQRVDQLGVGGERLRRPAPPARRGSAAATAAAGSAVPSMSTTWVSAGRSAPAIFAGLGRVLRDEHLGAGVGEDERASSGSVVG